MRSSFEHLRDEVRSLAKETVWFLFSRHEPGPKKDICLFATRRGGSTWLMELIGANKGVRFIDQPTSIQTRTLTASQARHVPKFDLGVALHLDSDQEERLRRFLDQVFEGVLPINAPTRMWRRDFDFQSNRLVLKLIDANAIIDWIATNYDVHIVYMTRHPIPQALSCIRNNWTLTTGAYLRNRWFTERYLGDGLLDYCLEILESGSRLEQFVLNWVFENKVPLELLPKRPQWIHVTYEECVLSPKPTILRLADALELDDVEPMLAKVGLASRSSRASTHRTRSAIAAGDRNQLVGAWRREVGADQERSAFRILERFGIGAYVPGMDLAV